MALFSKRRNSLPIFLQILLGILMIPAVGIRFHYLNNALIEPHPYRQTMSALVTQHFYKFGIDFFSYQSPDGGVFWNVMHEFPIFQTLATLLMHLGATLESGSRLATLTFFFLGSGLLFLIVQKLFNTSSAIFAFLSYLISPYNIIYSRTGLIDFTAQSFMLGAIYFSIVAIESGNRRSIILGTLCGTLGALVKAYVWFIPAGLGFAFLSIRYWKRREPESLYLLVGLLIQFVATISWILWTSHIRGPDWATLVSPTWIFGTIQQRLTVSEWAPQFQWILRFVLHDWMVIPLFLGLVLGPLKINLALSATILLPIMILFNSSQHHDYYLMNQSPYLFAIVGVGWEKLCKLRLALRSAFGGLTLLLFAHAMYNLPVLLAPLFYDYWRDLNEPLTLKSLSVDGDRIYLEGYNERFDMPLYSERLARPYYLENPATLAPSLLVFRDRIRPSALATFNSQWVVATSPFIAIRVKEEGPLQFNPQQHVGLMSSGSQTQRLSIGETRLNMCNESGDYRVYELQKNTQVQISLNNRETILSGGRYLYLPKRFNGQCLYLLQIAKSS